MPLRILEGEPPSPPAWGTLPLDIYLLSEWDTSHSSYLTEASQHPVPESPSGRRMRDVSHFFTLPNSYFDAQHLTKKQPYQSETVVPPTPTNSQITEILRPARHQSLRPYAEYTGSLTKDFVSVSATTQTKKRRITFVWPDSIIFNDKELFGGEEINLARFLETFPERVTNVGSVAHVEDRETILRDTLRRIQEDGGNTEAEGEDGVSEEDKNPLLQYGDYHAACVVTHMFIEDEEALDDDTANVVRHWRTDDEGRDYEFDGTWKEGNWKEDLVSGKGELGAAYCEGGVRGPAL
ncbi:conserved hypothetical protein [Aspergillus lentulus]|nr:conserved hypothetical protein [Aspergillus lentulus]